MARVGKLWLAYGLPALLQSLARTVVKVLSNGHGSINFSGSVFCTVSLMVEYSHIGSTGSLAIDGSGRNHWLAGKFWFLSRSLGSFWENGSDGLEGSPAA